MQQLTPTHDDFLPSSFRDPSGRIFRKDGKIYRNIHFCYKDDYEHLIQSGLYDKLVQKGWLVPHKEISAKTPDKYAYVVYKTIMPEIVPFISYPYEWCFSQLKDAAIRTMEIQLLALKHNMILKDASAYNIQFIGTRPLLIDTLSFARIRSGEPWPAYQQYCKHFLAPLLLMSKIDSRMITLFKNYIDGIPLDLASKLLPKSSWFRPSYLSHLHLHAWMQKRHSSTKSGEDKQNRKRVKVSELGVKGLNQGLLQSIKLIKMPQEKTEWGEYYTDTNYTERGLQHKIDIVDKMLDSIKPDLIWDLGANNGFFSRLGAQKEYLVIAMDGDHDAVEYNYNKAKESKEEKVFPLMMDLTNPSGGIGFNNNERTTIFDRGPADLVMALALIHHLAISNNTPFDVLAEFFSKCGRELIIEFVPKEDSQVQRLLLGREDVFDNYSQTNFEQTFVQYFTIHDKVAVHDSKRSIYHLKKKGNG